MTFQSNVKTNGHSSVPNGAVVDIDVRSDEPQDNRATHYGITPDYTININNPNTKTSDDCIISDYLYEKNHVDVSGKTVKVTPGKHSYTFKTDKKVNKTGVMLVGWGGNNGSTITAALYANKNKLDWMTKDGKQTSNYFGSLTQATTVRLGSNHEGKEVHIPFKMLLPMVDPDELVVGGWDINNANLADAMQRASVLEYDLQRQLVPYLTKLTPLPSIYYNDFIAANQSDRANNVIKSNGNKQADLEHIRNDIRTFKKNNGLDKVIVLWTANTERFTDVKSGLNTSAADILSSIKSNADEISQSNIFAVASILEGCPYINGSPQNTLVPGIIELAAQHNVFVGGDDFKSGQTKMKSVLVDFLVSAGMKPRSIVSYNHLGNNDGKNLSAPQQFRSKEISKSNVVDDMVNSNHLLYGPGEHPDHVVVIKYVPFVKDSKRAMDEYMSSIFMNGISTIAIHNTCEDSLLAAPLILDLVILTELMTRISYKTPELQEYENFHPVLSILSYLLKAPLVPDGTPVVNALMKQHRCITNILSACAGLAMDTDMLLEHKTKLPKPNKQ